MTLPTSRLIYLITFLGCTFLMAVALYMEHFLELEPCPMCIMQRVMVISTGIIALSAALHGPNLMGIRVYGGLCALTAGAGAAISIRHLWLQSLPEDQVPACGPGLDYLLDVFPLTEVFTMVLQGDGSCAEVLWSFLGLSIPAWLLIAFTGLLAIAALQIFMPRTAAN